TTFFERIRLISFFLFAPCLLKIYRQLEENRPNHSGKCKAYWQFFGIGILLIAMIFGLKSLVFDFSFTPLKIPLLVKFLLAAAFLSFLEEWLFRGLIFGAMVNAMKPFQAIIFSSLIFAYFHFSPRYSIPAHHTFLNLSDGFRCFYENIFPGLNHIAYLKFLIIFSLGCLLATVYFHSKNLFTAIGLHGGIVFALMICKTCFSFPVTNSFFGSNHLFDSPLAILLIATVGIGIHSYHGHFHPTK
ncbi:MAG: CPBP family intramembrane metalloprotease, partial [Puniceicoccales bacterium]|nr:CPBP family intramembrane metalloprotease [Puniceicoccales bacterium]